MFYDAFQFNQTLCWNLQLVASSSEVFFGSPGSFSQIPYPSCRPSPTATPSSKPSAKPSARPTSKPSVKPTSRPTIWSGNWTNHTYSSSWYGNYTSSMTMSHSTCPMGSRIILIQALIDIRLKYLSADCDDAIKSKLGPWKFINTPPSKIFSSNQGFNGWNVTIELGDTYSQNIVGIRFIYAAYGTYISDGPENNIDRDKNLSTTYATPPLHNQSIIGFRLYHDEEGIHALVLEYADFYDTLCYRYNGQPTGRKSCDTYSVGDYLGILYGFLTISGLVLLVGSIIRYILRKRQKAQFQTLDNILPLK